MESVAKYETIYEFDEFRLIPGENLLLRNGEPVSLPPKALRVLAVLVERSGHLVEKSEILDLIWEDAFVEEGSLSKAIWLIRNALGDTSKERFIQTIPRRGYRFVFPVSVITDASGAFRLADLRALIEDRDAVSAAEKPAANGASGELALNPVAAVTPVKNGAEHQASIPSMPSRRSMISWPVYAGIALVLLAGIVLYSVANGRYFGKGKDPKDRGTTNEEAYRLYQQAENLTQQRENMPKALDYLNQALILDPNFARVWAAKAHLNRRLATVPGDGETERYKKSMDAAQKALAIDPNLSEAYSALCSNKFEYEFDFSGAENDCKRALELDPNSSDGFISYNKFLNSRGRFDEAIAEIKRGLDRQPLSFALQQRYALTLYFARRFEEEEIQWKRLLEQHPTHTYIYYRLFINQEQQGKEDKAFDYLIQKMKLDKVDNETLESYRTAYAASGWRGVKMESIKHPERMPSAGPFDVACLYAQIGDKDRAFENLEKAYQEHNYLIPNLEVEPELDPIRDDPRYADLVRRLEGK